MSRTISQEQYRLSSWFLVHLCKIMISPGVFSIVLKFSFFGLLGGGGGKRSKNSPKWKLTTTSVRCHVSGTIKHLIMIFGALVVNADTSRCFFLCLKWYLQAFFHCFEIFIFWSVRRAKGKSMARLLSKHFYLQLFFAKEWVSLLFA